MYSDFYDMSEGCGLLVQKDESVFLFNIKGISKAWFGFRSEIHVIVNVHLSVSSRLRGLRVRA